MFQGSLKFQGCFEGVLRMFQGNFKKSFKVFHVKEEEVSRMFHDFQGCTQSVLKVF